MMCGSKELSHTFNNFIIILLNIVKNADKAELQPSTSTITLKKQDNRCSNKTLDRCPPANKSVAFPNMSF